MTKDRTMASRLKTPDFDPEAVQSIRWLIAQWQYLGNRKV